MLITTLDILPLIHNGYLYSAPSRNILRGALSPATAKDKCLKKLAERRHIVPGQQAQRRREFIPSWGVPIIEKARSCLSAERTRGTKSSPRAKERRARREAKSETGLQSSKMGHNQFEIARQVLKPYIKCVGRQEVSAGHHACKQKPRHI